MADNSQTKATLFFSSLLLLFIQTLTVWIESIYKISLTQLTLGGEAAGLLFAFSPLAVFLVPERAQGRLVWGCVGLFLAARAFLPIAGVKTGVLLGGTGAAAFMLLLCLLLSRRFRFLQGDAGIALGIALLMSIALRAWGATEDSSLSRSGAILGWVIIGVALGLLCSLAPAIEVTRPAETPPAGGTLGPVLGLFANFTLVYLVLSSPAVVEAWLGFDNTPGLMLGVISLGGGVLLLGRGFRVSWAALAGWNLLFGTSLVGGILALRITFPAAPEFPAVVVRPENTTGWLMLNLMFLLSPVVLFNVEAACRGLANVAPGARNLALSVLTGFTVLLLLTLTSIFSNVWGYVGPVSAVFRNRFHLPFLVLALLMAGTFFLPGWRHGLKTGVRPANRWLGGLTGALLLAALAGVWQYRPVTNAVTGKPKGLTILSYNMQQGADLGGNRNWENQLELIKAVNADIIGLQESDTARPSNGNVVAAKYFGAKLGYHIYYGPSTVSGTYGTAILSRYPLKNARTFFTFSDQDEVGTAVAEFEVDGKTFAFFNSHPSGSIPRKSHAAELVWQAKLYEYVIAVGDFNTTPREEPYETVTAALKDSWLERWPDGVGLLHPELRPHGQIRLHGSSGQIAASGDRITMADRIDHIFISQPLKAVESYYLPAPASQTDHPAHWTVVTWE